LKRRLKKRQKRGCQAKLERYFTLEETIRLIKEIKKTADRTKEPVKRADNQYKSWQRITKW